VDEDEDDTARHLNRLRQVRAEDASQQPERATDKNALQVRSPILGAHT
jgi:hypothetical protein